MSSCCSQSSPPPLGEGAEGGRGRAREARAVRRWPRRIRRWLGAVLLIGMFIMALSTALTQQLLPLAERHPEVIARWLSERAGRPIQFECLTAVWTRRGPLLQLTGLRIGAGEDAVRIGQADVLIAHYTGWLPGQSLTELRLRGLALVLERGSDGRWAARGLPGDTSTDGDPLAALEKLGELQVTGARLGISAPALGIETTLPDVDVRLRVAGTRVRAALRASMQAGAAPLRAVLDFDRVGGSGKAYAAIAQTDVEPWSPLLHLAGLHVTQGNGTIETWVRLNAWQVTDVTSVASLARVRIEGAPLNDESTPQQMAFGQVQLRAHWRNAGGQWHFHAPLLRMGDAAQAQVLDGLTLAGGRRMRMQAERIDAGPLLAVLALSDHVPPALRLWLSRAKPEAVLSRIALSANTASGTARGSLHLDGLRIASAGDAPGVSGLTGQITFAADGAVLDVDSEAAVSFDWPRGFGAPHHLHLDGALALWLDDGNIHLATPALRVEGEGYAADVYGGATFPPDGSRPRLDLAAALDAAQIPVAKRFWVRHQMPPAAIDWLDAALVAGTLRNGRALVAGDLDDWPFTPQRGQTATGLFEATGELVDATLRFQPDWPPLQRFNARVSFVNDGFSVQGRARLHGVVLNEVNAQLAHYGEGDLRINARARADLGEWLNLMRASSLNADHGEVLAGLRASGTATSAFAMRLPLHAGTGPAIDGRAQLAGNTLGDERRELQFSALAGEVRYDQHGFHADALAAVHAGQTGTLALRAGRGHVHEPAHAFEADLAMTLPAADLLARVPQLDWLRPHLSGQSPWAIGVAVDAADGPAAAPATWLTLNSNLIGTALNLPAPLDKPAGEALAARIHSRLPWDDGAVDVTLGERLAARATTTPAGTGIRVELGRASVNQAPPANGLSIGGRTPHLDASGWVQLGAGGGADSVPLQSLEIAADTLHLFGTGFSDVTLHARAQDAATQLTITAPALAGRITWPHAADAPVIAQLQHLDWPPLAAYAAGHPASDPEHSAEQPADITAPDSTIDPRRLPPLQLDIAELSLGGWKLGQASAATRPTAEGVEIEHLRIRGAHQQLDARGEWQGSGSEAATRLEIDVDSQNVGELLAGLGLGQQVKGGSGSLRLRGQWAASPMQLTPKRLTGTMEIAIRNGQLVEVEPGAGRVLGLFSVAQLPRRLLLDFRDFFGKGFGFNDITGTITAADGIARTDGLRINGPAAKIHISGSSDLNAQTHEQTIEVTPRTGNLLTAVGAFTGGPVGAAVGAAANAILKRPLGEIGAKTYRVTGPWQEPTVDVVAHPAPAPAANAGADADPAADAATTDAATDDPTAANGQADAPADDGGAAPADTLSAPQPPTQAATP